MKSSIHHNNKIPNLEKVTDVWHFNFTKEPSRGKIFHSNANQTAQETTRKLNYFVTVKPPSKENSPTYCTNMQPYTHEKTATY